MKTITAKFILIMVVIFGLLSSSQVTAAKKGRKVKKPKEKECLLFVRQENKTIPLKPRDLTFRSALLFGDQKLGLYGIPQPPELKMDLKPLEIHFFAPETGAAYITLARLVFVESEPAHFFDLKEPKVHPALFPKVYQVNPDDPVGVNLWVVEKKIPVQVTPVADKPGFFRVVPEQKLEAGNYAVHFGCLDGPRTYLGEQKLYPFTVAVLPEPPAPPPPKKKPARKRRPKEPEPVCPPVAKPPAPAREIPPPAVPEGLKAGFEYAVTPPSTSPSYNREYNIKNVNEFPWHNVNIKVHFRNDKYPDVVLGPIVIEKNIVLPEQTINIVPDKTRLYYETLNDENCKIYLEVLSKEGTIKKAWKNVSMDESGQSNLAETPWDLTE